MLSERHFQDKLEGKKKSWETVCKVWSHSYKKKSLQRPEKKTAGSWSWREEVSVFTLYEGQKEVRVFTLYEGQKETCESFYQLFSQKHNNNIHF